MQPEIDNSIGVPSLAFALSIGAIAYTYGPQMVREKFSEARHRVTFRQLCIYLMEKGYDIEKAFLIPNTNNWEVKISKEGKYFNMIFYADGNKILEQKDNNNSSVAFN